MTNTEQDRTVTMFMRLTDVTWVNEFVHVDALFVWLHSSFGYAP